MELKLSLFMRFGMAYVPEDEKEEFVQLITKQGLDYTAEWDAGWLCWRFEKEEVLGEENHNN